MAAYTYISRAEWGADPLAVQAGYAVPPNQFVGLVVHHTVIVAPDYDYDGMIAGDLDDECAYMRMLQHARPDLGLEVPYSFVLFEGADPNDIIIGEGRGWARTGAHTINYNSTRYGCALAGDYTDHPPTPGQLAGIRWIGLQLDDPAGAQPTLGHRDTYATACPGNAAYPLLYLVQPPFTAPAPIPEDDVTAPDYAKDSNGVLWVCGLGLHTQSLYMKRIGIEPDWVPVPGGGIVTSGPRLVPGKNGDMLIGARGGDGAAWRTSYDGAKDRWSGWVSDGGQLA